MLIRDLAIGSRVAMGRNPLQGVSRSDEPVMWIKANNQCDFLCTTFIGNAVYDAAEPQNVNKERRLRGNPYFPQSNLFVWLNGEGSDWFHQTHESDCKPNETSIMHEGFLSIFDSYERKQLIPRTYPVLTPKGYRKQFGAMQQIESLVSLPSASELGLIEDDPVEGERFHLLAIQRLSVLSRIWTRSTVGNSVVTLNGATHKFMGVAAASELSVHPVIRLDPAGEVEPDSRWFMTYCFNPYLSDEGDFSLSQLLSFRS